MSYGYVQAHNDDSDPYWACRYGVTTHPLYHECDLCPSAYKCDDPYKAIKALKELVPYDENLASCYGESLHCAKCDKIRFCQQIRNHIKDLDQLEKAGAQFPKWTLPRCRHDGYEKDLCCGCQDALYCPKLAEQFDLYSEPTRKPPTTLKERLLSRLAKFLVSLLPR